MEPALLIALLCVAVLIYRVKFMSRADKFLRQCPGPMKFTFIGNSWYLARSEERLSNILRLQQKYGSRVNITGGSVRCLMLFHPDDVQKILMSKELNKSRLYDLVFTDWLGSSLFFAKGKDYFRKRKMILPAFDAKRVDNFEETLNESSKILVNILKTNESEGRVTEIQELFRLCALDMASKYLVGMKMRSLENQENDYALAVQKETKNVTHRCASPWLWPELLWKISPAGINEKKSRTVLHEYMDKIVENRKAELDDFYGEESEEERGKMKLLDLLLQKQKEGVDYMTNKYVRDETNNVLFAAHDTVTSALTFTVYLIASHPEEQAELHNELDSVFGDDMDRNIRPSDLQQLKYLECCIKESLRLYPPAPILLRSVEKDFYLDENLTIPKGVEIGLSPWVTHRLAQFFPQPEKFLPSRFFPENVRGRHPYSYFPFSGGPRSCMGQKLATDKIKTILAHIFRSFYVVLEPGSEKFVPVGEMIMFVKNGLKIKLKSR